MSDRKTSYYWKCDRPSAFRTLTTSGLSENDLRTIENSLLAQLQKVFGSREFTLKPGGGQGNHLTFLAKSDTTPFFVRLENGPEKDAYMEIEARVLDCVRATGVPTPRVFAVDASREEVPYSYQFLEYHDYPDLNRWYKTGELDLLHIAIAIGRNIARWQSIRPQGFGPFDPRILALENVLKGLHDSYPGYFFLNWEKHLHFLQAHGVLDRHERASIEEAVNRNKDLLHLDRGCLVHKDLALWNILGTTREIKAFIDWDDTIAGDPTDDLSLLACFHTADVVNAAIAGYREIQALPDLFYPRFWLHLLRNMIVKAVIRVGGGYFDRHPDFFLIGAGSTGSSLRETTRRRILTALDGLITRKEQLEL